MMFLIIDSISIDLYSKGEKEALMKSLTTELSEIQYPFKFIAVSRPVDISPIISNMQEMIKFSNDNQKELLKKEIIEMNNFAMSGDIVERQFYITIWDKYQEGIEKEINRKAMLFAEKFTINNIGCEILNQSEIMRFINLINNPYYAHLEDKQRKINCVIVKDLSRFGRNYLECGNYLEKIFPFLNVRFIAINDSYDSNNENARNIFVMHLKNIVNEMYAKDISKKYVLLLKKNKKKDIL